MKRIVTTLLNILPYILVGLATLAHPADLDLGWHLRFGKDVLEQGRMIYENTYSTEMVGEYWFNSSWGLDVVRYIYWQYTGFWGLAILSSLLAIATYLILAHTFKLSSFVKACTFPLLIWVEDPFYIHSFRGQVISLLGLAIIYWVLEKYRHGEKHYVFLLIPIFFLWANIHAQFLLGLGVVGIWMIVFLLQNIKKGIKSHLKILGFVLVASTLVTLINPYGLDLYRESFVISSNPTLQFIAEFSKTPLFSLVWWNLVLWIILESTGILLLIRKKQFSTYLPYAVITVPLVILSFQVMRYHWPMYILSSPFIFALFKILEPKNKRIKYVITIIVLILSYFYVTKNMLPIAYLSKDMSWDTYAQMNGISENGVKLLKKMKNPGKVYTDYNYGGYMIWRHPEVKPAVDGRMSQWISKSGERPFVQYVMLEGNKNYVELAPFSTYFIKNDRPILYQLEQLTIRKKDQWKLIFRDQFASIYTRVK